MMVVNRMMRKTHGNDGGEQNDEETRGNDGGEQNDEETLGNDGGEQNDEETCGNDRLEASTTFLSTTFKNE